MSLRDIHFFIMEHFYQDIEGWFSYNDLYKFIVGIMPDDMPVHFVEIGAWYGKSTSFMAVEIANSKKPILFDTVDTWEGSAEHQKGEGSEDKNIIEKGSIYEEFLKNIEPVKEFVNPKRMTSLQAASTYQDNSLDFILLDASHEYEDVLADIRAWYPKIKKTGLFAGDDITWGGVAMAMYDYFPADQISRFYPTSNDWVVMPQVGPLANIHSTDYKLACAAGIAWHHLNNNHYDVAKHLLLKLNHTLYRDYNTFTTIYKGV